jgi:hypothetical protein
MGFMTVFAINRGLRGVMIDRAPHATVLMNVLMINILGVGTFISAVIVMTIVIVPALISPVLLLVWSFLLFWASLYATCLLHKRWFCPCVWLLMRNLGEDLKGAWREE